METARWLETASGSLLVATNQVPYDWWTAFHENSCTLRPFTDVEGNGGGASKARNLIRSRSEESRSPRGRPEAHRRMPSGLP